MKTITIVSFALLAGCASKDHAPPLGDIVVIDRGADASKDAIAEATVDAPAEAACEPGSPADLPASWTGPCAMAIDNCGACPGAPNPGTKSYLACANIGSTAGCVPVAMAAEAGAAAFWCCDY